MLTTEQIQTMKQNNISADAEKTMQRTEEVWGAAKNAVKRDILALADCARSTVYRIFRTGSIHIKLAVAMGQILDIDPYYLTGEADEPGAFSDALLLKLLEQHGYKQLLAELAALPAGEKPKRKYTRKPKPEAVEEEPEEEVTIEEVVIEETIEEEPAPPLDEEDLHTLLHALMILGKAGKAEAWQKLAAVQKILVS